MALCVPTYVGQKRKSRVLVSCSAFEEAKNKHARRRHKLNTVALGRGRVI